MIREVGLVIIDLHYPFLAVVEDQEFFLGHLVLVNKTMEYNIYFSITLAKTLCILYGGFFLITALILILLTINTEVEFF